MKTLEKTVYVLVDEFDKIVDIELFLSEHENLVKKEFVFYNGENWDYWHEKGYRCRKATLTINID